MVLSPPLLLLTASLTVSAVILHVESLQIKPSPPPHPPKSLSSLSSGGSGPATTTSPRPTVWNRGGGGVPNSSRQRRSSTTPLRAYTISENNSKDPWLSFFEKFPTSFTDLTPQFGAEDSLFSFEGGSATMAAAKPYMPNLEMETAAITATEEKDGSFNVEKDELLSELNALTKTFDELQSSMDYKSQLYSETMKGYECKIGNLEQQNNLLEEGLDALTVTLELKGKQIEELQEERVHNAVDEGERVNDNVQDEVKKMEKENDALRQRLRFLEVELSDVAFESRKAATPRPPATVEKRSDNDHNSSEESTPAGVDGVGLSPKAPSAPVPPHIYQQRQLEQLQRQVVRYERERSSARKLFGLGISRGMAKVGKVINLWNPVYNLMLWGELRGQGNVVM